MNQGLGRDAEAFVFWISKTRTGVFLKLAARTHRQLHAGSHSWVNEIGRVGQLEIGAKTIADQSFLAENCCQAFSQSCSTGVSSGNSMESRVTRALRLPC